MLTSACSIRALAASLAAATLLAGCGSLPPLKHVILSPPQTQRLLSARPSDWEVQRVRMPEYLDNYKIQLRTQDYVLTPLPNAKWAERLPIGTTHRLQRALDDNLGHDRDKRYDVRVQVDTFEPQPSGQVVLAAKWRVTDSGGGVIARDQALIETPVAKNNAGSQLDAGAIGRAMSAAIRELAMQIVARTG